MNKNPRPSVGIQRVAYGFVALLSLLFCWKYLPRYCCDAPLMQAIEAGDVTEVRYLLDRGANANAVGWPTCKSGLVYLLDRSEHSEFYTERTALMLAATKEQAEIERLLLEHGADVHLQTSNKMTALENAAGSARPDNVRLLLAYGAGKDRQQLTAALVETATAFAMMHSDQANYEECLRLLLQAGADINARDSYGNYALTLAAQAAHTEEDARAIQFLLRYGANPNVTDGSGRTPLRWAQENNNPAILQCLQNVSKKK